MTWRNNCAEGWDDIMYICVGVCYGDVAIIIDGWADSCE